MPPSTKKLVVRPAEAGELLDCSQSYLYELIRAGELESFEAGTARKITTASIEAYIRRRLAANRRKIRTPPIPQKRAGVSPA
jgi:excisionase family DNA binding protein